MSTPRNHIFKDSLQNKVEPFYLIRIFLSGCVDGDVMLGEDYTPMMFQDGRFRPICQHSFHVNEFGVKLFCKTLGYQSGVITEERLPLAEAAILIGKCLQRDTDLRNCTGGYNAVKIGNGFKTEYCNEEEQGRMKVICYGGEGKVHTCKGRQGISI